MTPKRNLPNDSRTFSNLNTRNIERSRKFGAEGGGREEQESIIDFGSVKLSLHSSVSLIILPIIFQF